MQYVAKPTLEAEGALMVLLHSPQRDTFDVARERMLAGFVDRGKRRYRSYDKSTEHRRGWTSATGADSPPPTPHEPARPAGGPGGPRGNFDHWESWRLAKGADSPPHTPHAPYSPRSPMAPRKQRPRTEEDTPSLERRPLDHHDASPRPIHGKAARAVVANVTGPVRPPQRARSQHARGTRAPSAPSASTLESPLPLLQLSPRDRPRRAERTAHCFDYHVPRRT